MVNEARLLLRLTRKFVLTFLVSLAVVLLLVVLGTRSWINRNTAVFTASASPQNIYTVNLKGAKGRPFLLPYSVSADVYKMGEPYVADVLLHTAWDAFDLSFELGFPEIRWQANNAVEFYRPENCAGGNDVIIVQNRSGKSVTSLFIDVESKFLVVDVKPGGSLSLKIPKPRGNSQWIALEGVLGDGTKISLRYDNPRWRIKEDCTYLLSIFESSVAIASRKTGCR